jgi:S-methylmethionine-dependent homocysteine/selenocysteine methylase
MNFVETINRSAFILTEGAVIERLNRDPSVDLDPHILNSGLIYDDQGRTALEIIYRQYIDIGLKYNFPILLSAPTWRANPERIDASQYQHHKTLNADCVRFMQSIRDSYKDFAKNIFIGGMMACRGDAYRPEEALSESDATEFHKYQAAVLAESGADFIMAATLPAVSEARGIATAIAAWNIPYIVSFVIRPNGALLDGTSLHRAIEQIDAIHQHAPFFYLVNCVHPTAFDRGLDRQSAASMLIRKRLIGLQANTSARSPEELDGLEQLDGSEPEGFAEELLALHHKFGIKVIGGCCGTDHRHIEAIAARLHKIY